MWFDSGVETDWNVSRLVMGPREALEQISAMIKTAVETNDLQAVQALLREMQAVTERAIGAGTLRRARLTRVAQSAGRTQ